MRNRSAYRVVAAIVLACAAIACTVVARSLPPDPNNPTGTHGLILVDKLGSRVRFLNPDTYTELSNIDVGSRPHEMAISPDHKTAYVSIYGDGVYGNNPHPGHTIAVVDLAKPQRLPKRSTCRLMWRRTESWWTPAERSSTSRAT